MHLFYSVHTELVIFIFYYFTVTIYFLLILTLCFYQGSEECGLDSREEQRTLNLNER